jgi:hypothetical protein
MARDPRVESMLHAWAEFVSVGDGSGYPTVSVLHKSWMPPAPGRSPTIKVARSSAAACMVHRALHVLGTKWRRVAVVHYVKGGPIVWQAEQLGCQPGTVHARVEALHAKLAVEFCKMESPAYISAT